MKTNALSLRRRCLVQQAAAQHGSVHAFWLWTAALLLGCALWVALQPLAHAAAAGSPAQGAGARGALQPAQPTRVVWVYDGDTLRLESGQSVRLAGLDSPELGKKGQKDQHYARDALHLAMKLAKNTFVTCNTVSRNSFDKYGRMVTEILLPDGSSLNQNLVSGGAAWVYWHRDLHADYIQRLLTAQRDAIEQGRGMWPQLLSGEAATRAYTGNAKSYRFFPADSAEAKNIHFGSVVRFSNLKDAFWQGYAPGRTRDPRHPDAPPRVHFLP